MLFKVNDKVKMRKDLKVGGSYGPIKFEGEDMERELSGTVVTISYVDAEAGCYTVDGGWIVSEEMIWHIVLPLRVWHMPQVTGPIFYVPVESEVEAMKVLNIIAAYDLFLLDKRYRRDFSNMQGVEMYDESQGEWVSWEVDTSDDYFDELADYLGDNKDLEEFSKELFGQLKHN